MSALDAAQWTAIATIALAALAIVTAIFAYLAFRSQAQAAHQLGEDRTGWSAPSGHGRDRVSAPGYADLLCRARY
jgi:hypothetical protein